MAKGSSSFLPPQNGGLLVQSADTGYGPLLAGLLCCGGVSTGQIAVGWILVTTISNQQSPSTSRTRVNYDSSHLSSNDDARTATLIGTTTTTEALNHKNQPTNKTAVVRRMGASLAGWVCWDCSSLARPSS
mmetsp:Transcript_6683/g.13608  ORF Transcript_6683/g.13608 Transcript_6683/m.13608 type:complete len:131 (-) Transcript_6683:282-674(-)